VEINRVALFTISGLLAFSVGEACAAAEQEIAGGNSNIIATDSPVSPVYAADIVQDIPMGQDPESTLFRLFEEGAMEDLFGLEGGYLHPYLSLEGAFTDNAYNVGSDKTSSFLNRISPGIWFTLPRKKIIPITIATHNASPGGLQLELDEYGGTDRFQLYALAGADLFFYSDDSDANTFNTSLEGMGRYNMPSGLSLQLLDRYSFGHDGFGVGLSTDDNLREFENNLLMATVDWEVTEKVRVKINYSNFILMYDSDNINSFLERQDDSVDLFGYYQYSVKTSLFLQYRYTNIEYDIATDKNNNQNYFYGGVRWNTTEKLALMFKTGLQNKEFDKETSGFEGSKRFVVDFQTHYRATEKTEVVLDLYRKTEESDSEIASERVVFGTKLNYTQKVTEKITGTFDFYYENSVYSQLEGSDREDDIYQFRPAVQYFFRDWLMGELAYAYEMRDSSDALFDYDTNTFFFSLNFAL
jgi:hypothetical protein